LILRDFEGFWIELVTFSSVCCEPIIISFCAFSSLSVLVSFHPDLLKNRSFGAFFSSSSSIEAHTFDSLAFCSKNSTSASLKLSTSSMPFIYVFFSSKFFPYPSFPLDTSFDSLSFLVFPLFSALGIDWTKWGSHGIILFSSYFFWFPISFLILIRCTTRQCPKSVILEQRHPRRDSRIPRRRKALNNISSPGRLTHSNNRSGT
jgi:hypothetical protein